MSTLTDRQKKRLTLIEAWGGSTVPYLGDFFTTLAAIAPGSFVEYPIPWADVISASSLDIGYFLEHSGNKTISNLTYQFLKLYDVDALTTDNKRQLVYTIYDIYKQRWAALWETVTAEYNPIHNYDMTEQETTNYGKTDNRTFSGTSKDTITGSNSATKHGSVATERERESNGEASNNNALYGFNSTEASPSDSGEGTNKITENETGSDTSTETDSGSYSETNEGENGYTDNNVEGGSDSRTLTRSGNIGVTTTQQMLQSERELWTWDFVKQVYDDLDKYLASSVYGRYY